MPSRPTTRWQVSGYRFLVRRMEHALVRRDVRMLHDPMRSQSRAYVAGLVLALVALAGAGVLALLRPQGQIGDHKIVMGKDSGQIYAVVDGTVHPALNLASARLAVGDPAKPESVKESELAKKHLGALIGIPGAPSSLHFDTGGKGRAWTVCDQIKNDGSAAVTSTVIAGTPTLGDVASVAGHGQALLVAGKNATFLIYDNKRARVDTTDPAVVNALHIRDTPARPVSEGLLNAIPETLPITSPKINDPGGMPVHPVDSHRIGDVVHLSTDDTYYVVLHDGLQHISALTADIIRNASPTASQGNTEISAYTHSHTPTSTELPVADYPDSAPTIVTATDAPVACLQWKPLPTGTTNTGGGKQAELALITGRGLPLPDGSRPTQLAQSGQPGLVAQFYTTPGSGMFVQTTGIEPDSQRKDSQFYIADTGVRYGIKDADAAKALGMDAEKAKPEPAPWQIAGLLPGGPTLGREDAMVAHDGIAPDANPAPALVKPSQN